MRSAPVSPAPFLVSVLRELANCLCIGFLCCGQGAAAADAGAEERLISVLQSNASLKEKDAACAQLKRIGTEQCIPALAALLPDEQLSHSARYALESMPYPKAGEVLIEALRSTKGQTQVGIINSLGVRREKAALAELAKLLPASAGGTMSNDTNTPAAAAVALGRIGGVAARDALRRALPASIKPVRSALADGLLRCASDFLSSGSKADALSLFHEIFEANPSAAIRTAAWRGVILSSGNHSLDRVTEALAGSPGPAQTAALQLAADINAPGATRAYMKLLPNLQPAVQVGLIEAMARRADPHAAPAIEDLIMTSGPPIRCVGMSALGALGDASVVPLLLEFAVSTDHEEQSVARQALLAIHRGRVTEALLQALVNPRKAIQTEASRALAGRADVAAVPRLLELAARGPAKAHSPALLALAEVAGQSALPQMVKLVLETPDDAVRADAADALSAACRNILARTGKLEARPLAQGLAQGQAAGRVALLPVCSGVVDEDVRTAMRNDLHDANPSVRDAAARAICASIDPSLLPDLQALARQAAEPQIRALATEACVRLVSGEETRLAPDKRLAVLQDLLASPLTVAEKRLVLSGLGDVPDPRSLTLVAPYLDDAEVKAEAAQATLRIASHFAGPPDQAIAALKKVSASDLPAPTREAAAKALNELQSGTEYITQWQVAGPYHEAGKNYAALFNTVFPPEAELESRTASNSSGTHWRSLPAHVDPTRPWVMDLLQPIGGEQCVAYAQTYIRSPGAQKALLKLGSDDGIKVWLNGKVVYAKNTARPLTRDSDTAPISLNAGWNSLLLKITQNSAGWEFSARIVKPDGAHLDGLEFSAEPHPN